MLVCAIDGAVDAVPLIVSVTPKRMEKTLPSSFLRPSIETIEHRLPRPKLGRQISPWHSSTPPPEYRFDEVPVVSPRAPEPSFRGQERFELAPHTLAQLKSNHIGPLIDHTIPGDGKVLVT
jgi:hypothetical protein